MKVWWLTINRAMKNTYLGLKYRKVIAQGWPGLGDLSILANYFSPYWQENRPDFERLIQLLACPIYPADAAKPPAALKNLYNLMNIAQGDLVVAVSRLKVLAQRWEFARRSETPGIVIAGMVQSRSIMPIRYVFR